MDSFLVTTACSDPAAARELIRIALTTPVTNSHGDIEWASPCYKQNFLDMAEKQKGMTTIYYFDGGSFSTSDPETAEK